MATAPRPKTTVLADDTTLDKPQSTSTGDAPADTFTASEKVSSATPNKAAAAAAGHQSVNAVAKAADVYVTAPAGGARTETVYAYDGTGKRVSMTHNIVTGETTKAA